MDTSLTLVLSLPLSLLSCLGVLLPEQVSSPLTVLVQCPENPQPLCQQRTNTSNHTELGI